MPEMIIETCSDCNWYDDISREDTFLYSFPSTPGGEQVFICGVCAEDRGISASDVDSAYLPWELQGDPENVVPPLTTEHKLTAMALLAICFMVVGLVCL